MYVLGIHPDGDYFKVALLTTSRKKIRIVFLQEFKKDIININQLKKKVLKEAKYRPEKIEVVSGLTPEEVFVKKISFPFSKKRAVLKALPFQMEKVLPFSDEHVYTVPDIAVRRGGSDVTLYTFFQEAMLSHLQEIKMLGFDSTTVSTVSRALFRFKKVFVGEESHALLYFGWERSYLVYADSHEVRHSVVVECGFKEIVDAAKEGYPIEGEIDFSYLKGEIVKYFGKEPMAAEMRQVLGKLQKGLFRAFEYVKRKENVTAFSVVHLGYSAISEEMVGEMHEVETEKVESIPHLEFDSQQIKSYAIEIGLALEYDHIQLKGEVFTSGKERERIQHKIKTCFATSIIASLALIGSLTFLWHKKYKEVQKRHDVVKLLEHEGGLTFKEPRLLTESLQELSGIKSIRYENGKLEVETDDFQ